MLGSPVLPIRFYLCNLYVYACLINFYLSVGHEIYMEFNLHSKTPILSVTYQAQWLNGDGVVTIHR